MRVTGVYLFIYLEKVNGEQNFLSKVVEGRLPGVLFREINHK